MKFKKFKYNIICMLLVLLIGVGVAVKVIFVDPTQQASNVVEQLPNEQEQNNSTNSDNSNNNQSGGTQDKTKYEKDSQLPSTRYPVKLINYCLKKLEESYSYQTSIYFTSTFTVAALNATSTQLCKGTSTKMGESRFEDMQFQGDSLSVQFFRMPNAQITYTDGKTYHRWKAENEVYDINQGAYTTTDKAGDPAFRFYYDLLNPGGLTINSKTYNVTAVKDNAAGVYKVTLKLIDKKNYPENFRRSYDSFSQGLNIKQLDQTIVFEIDSVSGWIKNFVKSDTFYSEPYQAPGVDVRVDLKFTQTFVNYNQDFTYTLPPFPETK